MGSTVTQISTVSQNTQLLHNIVICHMPVTPSGPITTTGPVKSLIYTKNTRSCIMTSTGYYRLPYNQDRLFADNSIHVLPGWVKSL